MFFYGVLLVWLGAYAKRLFFRMLIVKDGLSRMTDALKLQLAATRLRMQRTLYAGVLAVMLTATGAGLYSKFWCVARMP